jgi:hypothetical protein
VVGVLRASIARHHVIIASATTALLTVFDRYYG